MEKPVEGSILLSEADATSTGHRGAERRANERKRKELALRLEAAREEVARLAGLMARDSGLRRARIFGSAETGRGYRSDPVIDLSIEGGELFPCMAASETSSYRVEVVELQGLPPRPRLPEAGMDRLHRFRHAFCDLCLSELDSRKLKLVDEGVPSLVADFLPLHERFAAALDLVAEELEGR